MNDRFKFNAVVSSYYDIDTPEDYQEFEPTFYLKNVDVFCTGEIGIDYDTLLNAVKEQSKDLAEKEIGQIMQHFEDNSNSPECDFVTITPDKILQCTGLKDKNGKLIYEGDIINVLIDSIKSHYIKQVVIWDRKEWQLKTYNKEYRKNCSECGRQLRTKCKCCSEYFSATGHTNFKEFYNGIVIGNIYENKELLEEECQK